MPLVPISVGGKVRLVSLPPDATGRDMFLAEVENIRRQGIDKRRRYYGGEQYDEENHQTAVENHLDPMVQRLPEHLRLHAYSTHIDESVDFIASQLAESFEAVAKDAAVQAVIDEAMINSDQITGSGDSEDATLEDVFRDSLIAGDVAVELRWDPDGTIWYEFWDSEQVQFDWADRRTLQSVTREEIIWVEDVDGDREVRERVVYDLVANGVVIQDDDGFPTVIRECRRQVYWDDEESPRDIRFLGLPFLPWVLLKCTTKSLRAMRGESIVTDQCMEHADRYNANEQIAYLCARYNSHGNLAVVGDAAALKVEKEGGLGKDVTDVLTFPGGTSVSQITLPTDPKMIDHQRMVLAEAMYSTFGLTRVDQETVSGLSGVSGYALEILNRKTDGTFRRITKNFVRDLRVLFSMTLDLRAYLDNIELVYRDLTPFDPTREVDPAKPIEDQMPFVAFWEVDPDSVFSNREIEIRMGSGYIVDDVLVRDDFLAKLISRKEALRRRGWSDDDIKRVEEELEEEAPPQPEDGLFTTNGSGGGTKAGATVGAAGRG